MVYRFIAETGTPDEWGSLLDGILIFWNTIGEPDFEPGHGSWEFLLHERSGLEFIRDQLTEPQRRELDQVDAYWKKNASTFNEIFRLYHGRKGKPYPNRAELEGWVEDEEGKAPSIPSEHWWWWPVE